MKVTQQPFNQTRYIPASNMFTEQHFSRTSRVATWAPSLAYVITRTRLSTPLSITGDRDLGSYVATIRDLDERIYHRIDRLSILSFTTYTFSLEDQDALTLSSAFFWVQESNHGGEMVIWNSDEVGTRQTW
ncbi:hypothetical protein Tco_0158474 [Tanacetum coccineum]